MKMLKVFLPSIALMVVLALSITIGVYAANNISFTVSSTISFKSPDVSAKIYCFVNAADEILADTENYERNANHIWDSSNKNATDWDLSTENDFKFTTIKGSDQVAPIILTFVVQNNTPALPIYGYFVNPTNVDQTVTYPKITEDVLDGTKNTQIVSVDLMDEKQIAPADEGKVSMEAFTITFNMVNTSVADTVEFNYALYLSKWAYTPIG